MLLFDATIKKHSETEVDGDVPIDWSIEKMSFLCVGSKRSDIK